MSARELFKKLNERPRPSEVVDLPVHWPLAGEHPRVRIVVLRNEEFDDARMEASALMRKKYGLSGNELDDAGQAVQSDWVARHIIARAVHIDVPIEGSERMPGGPFYHKLFASAEEVAAALHRDELGVLSAHYSNVQDRCGPIESSVYTEEEVTEWIDRLAEGAALFPLDRLDSQALAQLCQSFAGRLYCMCAIHDCPPESWPRILESLPMSWRIGIGFFGAGRANATAISFGLFGSDGEPLFPYEPGQDDDDDPGSTKPLPIAPMSLEEAVRRARDMGGLIPPEEM